MIKTRFAPSPTGYVHIGSLKMALTDYIIARQNNGQFVLRVEDTDRERLVAGAIENLLRTLDWAGINPDEGVKFGENNQIVQVGDKGPYIQSERLDIYHKYIDELLEKGHAYHCFCTKERLSELRKVQELNKQATGYDGHCRNLSKDEIKIKMDAGESYVVRMKMPKEGDTKFTDLIRGEVSFENKLIDDQVILKADGFPTYHLAVVVDDHLMEISHVIRGEEWLPSTPKHIELYRMFGWEPPLFAHLPLLLNPDKSKLSKRQGDVAVEDYIKKGYLPEAIINFVVFLGWNPGTEQEIFSLEELVKEFSFEKVNKAGAVFNLEKLDWYNKQYIMQMDSKELAKRCELFFINQGIEMGNGKWEMGNIVALEQGRASTLLELVDNVSFIFAKKLNYEPELLVWKKSTAEDAKNKLQELSDLLNTFSEQYWNKDILEVKVGEWIGKQGYGMGDVLWPMRVALSGQKNSPGPYEIAGVLGKGKTLERLESAIDRL